MNYLRYGWTVFVNLVTLYVLLQVFDLLYEPFERIIVVLLVLIYLSLVEFSMVWGKVQLEMAFVLEEKFHLLENRIEKKGEEANEVFEEVLNQHREDSRPQLIKAYINSVVFHLKWHPV